VPVRTPHARAAGGSARKITLRAEEDALCGGVAGTPKVAGNAAQRAPTFHRHVPAAKMFDANSFAAAISRPSPFDAPQRRKTV